MARETVLFLLEEKMDIIQFLDTLANTLEQIEVKGRENHNRLMGCFIAIDQMKYAISKKDGEGDGRQVDIPTDGSDNSTN